MKECCVLLPRWQSGVTGLESFPRHRWLLYFLSVDKLGGRRRQWDGGLLWE